MIEKECRFARVVLISAVNFFTGQFFDIAAITAAAAEAWHHGRRRFRACCRQRSAVVARLECRFRRMVFLQISKCGSGRGRWCFRPRAPRDQYPKLLRLAGWFGNDPNTRFRMHLEPEFIRVPSG